MRIISGKLKGKKLFFLNSIITRPLRDLVKESIFNVILHSNLFDARIDGSNILDLYSGIGSFGLESISRGAANVSFIENDKLAIDLLKKNITNIAAQNQTKLYEKTVSDFSKQINTNNKYDIIFCDPPFAENFYIDELKIIKERKIYNKKHLIIIHRQTQSEEYTVDLLKILLIKKYGKSKSIVSRFA